MTTIRSARFGEMDVFTLYAILRLRADVFVVEQHSPFPDLDGRDVEPTTRHLWITNRDDTDPLAYLRVLIEPDGTARIGRVVTAPAARRRGFASELLGAALDAIGDRPCVLDAQSQLTEYYARLGFDEVGPEFVEDGIPHVPMRRCCGRTKTPA